MITEVKALLIKEEADETRRFGFVPVTLRKNGDSCYDDISSMLEGTIEGVNYREDFFKAGIAMYCNDEHKLIHGMLPSLAVIDKDTGNLVDVLSGRLLFTGLDAEGETVSLTEEQKKMIIKTLHSCRIEQIKGIRTSGFCMTTD